MSQTARDCSILSAEKYWTVSPVKPFSTTRFLHCCPRCIQENIQMFLLGLRYSQKLAELQLIWVWVNVLMLNLNGGLRAAKDFAVSVSQLETLKQWEIKNSDHAWQNHALGQSMIQNASKSNYNMDWRIVVLWSLCQGAGTFNALNISRRWWTCQIFGHGLLWRPLHTINKSSIGGIWVQVINWNIISYPREVVMLLEHVMVGEAWINISENCSTV